jgi:glycosyltransferase involved in cell wall biosynthesis
LNLRMLLKKESSLPDVVFIGYPPIETAVVMSSWLKKRKVPILLDIKDLWPSIFIDTFPKNLKSFAKIIFYPYFYMARKTIANSSGISTMSQGFLNWSLNFSKRQVNLNDKIIRLTTSNIKFKDVDIKISEEWWKKIGVYPKTIKVFFVGTFSTAFEFDQIYLAALNLKECQFVLCGHGPCLDEIKNNMKGLDNVVFPGWVDRVKIKSLANMSIASIAPYKNIENFTLNIPNKIVDSLLLGVPILSPLEGEVKSLIEENNVGLIYDDSFTLINCILKLIDNRELQIKMSVNSKKLYDSEFEFNKVYNSLVSHLEGMAIKRVQ